MALAQIPGYRQQLFDGLNDEFYQFSHQFPTLGNLSVSYWDFNKNYFDDLAETIPTAELTQLVQEGRFQHVSGPFGGYIGSDKFGLNYFLTGSLLFVFASGEFQPGRYKIYLEGVWQRHPER